MDKQIPGTIETFVEDSQPEATIRLWEIFSDDDVPIESIPDNIPAPGCVVRIENLTGSKMEIRFDGNAEYELGKLLKQFCRC